jgi:hypothetical protein
MRLRTLALLPALLTLAQGLPAQEEAQGEGPFRSAWAFYAHFSQRGPGFGLEHSRGSGIEALFSLDAAGIKDLRESLTLPVSGIRGKRFVFGKLNHLVALSPSAGLAWDLGPRSALSPLGLRLGLKAGPSLGLLRPYYLEILSPSPTQPPSIEAYDPSLHSYFTIGGRAGLFSAPLRLRLQTGLSAKAFIDLDIARQPRSIQHIRLSFNADYYFSPPPILAEHATLSNRQLFLSGGMSLGLGSRK